MRFQHARSCRNRHLRQTNVLLVTVCDILYQDKLIQSFMAHTIHMRIRITFVFEHFLMINCIVSLIFSGCQMWQSLLPYFFIMGVTYDSHFTDCREKRPQYPRCPKNSCYRRFPLQKRYPTEQNAHRTELF